ncbi:MAG: LlaJI family restriction endonuclease [Akkermansia sp.]|nr:LlaJI family restriction endonuclease [Akkermansia sp.]
MERPDIILVRECEPYTREELLSIFAVDSEEWPQLAERLEHFNMLRRRSTVATDELSGSEFEKHLSDAYEFSLRFVGVYIHRKRVIWSMPKYMHFSENKSHLEHKVERQNGVADKLSTVMSVLRRYTNGKLKEALNCQNPVRSDDYLSLLIYIVTDFAHNGVYRDDVYEERLNGRGRVLWHKTIQSTKPYIQGNKPCYMDLVVRRTIEDEENFFTRLHLKIVADCQHILDDIGLIKLFALPRVDEIEEHNQDLGNVNYLEYCIHGELRNQFDSRRRHILLMMLNYLRCQTNHHHKALEEIVYGSTSFHAVWEEVCREVLGKDYRKEYRIAFPEWQFVGHNEWFGPQDSLEPDIIIERKDSIWLFDAKYYHPRVNKGKVSQLPGVQDVTKQFLYQKDLQKNKENFKKIFNAFLMPMPDAYSSECEGNISLFARVSMPLFGDCVIYSYFLRPQEMYEAYLHVEKREAIQKQMESMLNKEIGA